MVFRAAAVLMLALLSASPVVAAACPPRPSADAELAACEAAAKAGDGAAALALGDALGDPGSRRYAPAEALRWWEAAAANGRDAALRRLFDAAWYGRGAAADPARAEAWLELAISRGLAWARLVKAVRAEEGDAAAAAALYGEAAVAGSCQAQLRLAHGHDRGGWVERNRAQAYFWSLVAGRPDAVTDSHSLFDERFHYSACRTEAYFLKGELAKVLAPDQRARAEAQAAAWVAGQLPDRVGPAEAPAALGVATAAKPASLPGWAPLPMSLKRTVTTRRANPEAVFAAAGPAVWVVVAARSEDELKALRTRGGSAVAVDEGRLVTNCHVVADMGVVFVKQGRRILPARPAAGDPASDRCLLQVEGGHRLVPVPGVRDYAALKVGETVYSIGAPRGLEATLGQGLVSGLRSIKGVRYVQTTAPISAGSSGGGLFDAAGNLVGVTTFQLREGQGINFAIAAEDYFQ